MIVDDKIEELREEIINSTQGLVRIKSIQGDHKENMPFGKEVNDALEYTLNLSKSLGFKTVNLNGYVGYAEYGTGSEYIAVLGHLDVVPEGDGWTYPPFGAEIHNGKIYGRGTVDDKSPIISSLYGLKSLVDLNIPLKRKVRIIFGTNEETGCKDMPEYNKIESPPIYGFTPDGHYPIVFAEKGLTVFDLKRKITILENSGVLLKYLKGGAYANMVPSFAEALLITKFPDDIALKCKKFSIKENFDLSWEIKDEGLLIKSHGISAHGSTPALGKNAVMQLLKFLGEILLEKDELSDLICFLNKKIGFETDGKSLGINLYDSISGSLSFNLGAIALEDNELTIKLNIRYPIKNTLDDMVIPFKENLAPFKLNIENMWHKNPLYFSEDHPLITTLQKVYKNETGLEPQLLSIGMGTYAKEIKNIVAFGPILPGRIDLDHKADENILIEDLILNTKIYAKAILELANLESRSDKNDNVK